MQTVAWAVWAHSIPRLTMHALPSEGYCGSRVSFHSSVAWIDASMMCEGVVASRWGKPHRWAE